jgi:plastocyanin
VCGFFGDGPAPVKPFPGPEASTNGIGRKDQIVKRLLPMAMQCGLLCGVPAGMVMFTDNAWCQTAPHDHVVTMSNMSFGRIPTDLKVGDTITWINRDTVPHTVTARDKSFDLRMAPGKSAHMTVQKAGSFPFYCIYHATMRGTLTVAAQ